MKKSITILMFIMGIVSNTFSQSQPYLLIDNVNTQFTTVSFPYWLKAGQTINLSTNSKSVSILEFNVNGTNLEFSQAISLTSSQTVPTNKVWKIEAIGLIESSTSLVNLSNSGTSTSSGSTNLPTIYQSPAKYSTPGTYIWKVPPGITSICVEVWGGGGKGGSSGYALGRGGGGGGGGYGYECFSVVPGTSYTVTVGAGGISSNIATQTSSFGTLITATGGSAGGAGSSGTNGVGGIGGTSSATFNLSGYNGFGGNGTNSGNGGNGANGGFGGVTSGGAGYPPTSGSSPGGGGGSGDSYITGGAAGAPGQVIIYW